jgi:zona occludens toxin
MAITLITGTPGSGKTLYAVSLLRKEAKAGRRLVVDGIRDLALDHEFVDGEWVRDWMNRCQHNDFIVIDEVQRIWPPQSVSVKVGPDIEALHVHRHKGVDFLIITQHPQRLHKTIRDLVGRHVHVRRMFGMRWAMLYEWDHCHNPNAGFRDAVKTRWSYPKSVFKLYTSAELHTKPKGVIPKALYFIPVALVVGAWFAWRGLHDFFPNKFGNKPAGAASAASAVSVPKVVSRPDDSKLTPSEKWRVAGQYSVDGRGYVLLAGNDGRFRSELSDKFHGDTLRVEGDVDGERVGVWTGGAAPDADKKGVGK